MEKRKPKTAVIIIAVFLAALLLTVAVALFVLRVRTSLLREDISSLYVDKAYAEPVKAEGVEVITQDVSCGYAVLEMFSAWCGQNVTEESLYEEYGKVVTSTGKAFCEEMNRRFPEYATVMQKYLRDTELIRLVYGSLEKGVPVPFEWAALYGDEWTLHYSLITGLDVPGDRITVANPYGYFETLTLSEFLERTRFDAYRNMPLFLKMGFAFGIFEKNTVFIPG